jgi:hypothetical protein
LSCLDQRARGAARALTPTPTRPSLPPLPLQNTSLAELQQGLAHLQEDADARRSALQTLVKDNFERFISCKTTIDDVLATLRRGEGQPHGAQGGAAASKRGQAAAPAAQDSHTSVRVRVRLHHCTIAPLHMHARVVCGLCVAWLSLLCA